MHTTTDDPACRGREHRSMEVVDRFEAMTEVAEYHYEVRRCRDCGFEDKFCVEIRPRLQNIQGVAR